VNDPLIEIVLSILTPFLAYSLSPEERAIKAKADLFYPAKLNCLRHSRGCKSAIRQFAN